MRHDSTTRLATDTNEAISAYWDHRIHDTELSRDPPDSAGYFAAMDAYRYGRLDYLAALADFDAWSDCDVLDVGCGAGLDLMRFARSGARAVGAELSAGALDLARRYFAVSGRHAALVRADGARLPFRDEVFDLVFCHSVLPFARDGAAIVAEAWRVLREGGSAIFMVYNRHSWLYVLRSLAAVGLGHDDAPAFSVHSRAEFEALLAPFQERAITAERLPAKSTLHRGFKGALFNHVFVRGTQLLPDAWMRPLGWHLVARCTKRRAGSKAMRALSQAAHAGVPPG
jgi:SAM-dependent methyltransferase